MSNEQSVAVPANTPKLHTGSCHCAPFATKSASTRPKAAAAIARFATRSASSAASSRPAAFQLLSGQDSITEYVWGSPGLAPLILQAVRCALLRRGAPRAARGRLRLDQPQHARWRRSAGREGRLLGRATRQLAARPQRHAVADLATVAQSTTQRGYALSGSANCDPLTRPRQDAPMPRTTRRR